MQDLADPLAQLHDILLPDTIGWWPPAPGWWLLLAIIVGLIVLLLYISKRKTARNRYRLEAIAELAAIDHADTDPARRLQAWALLLRRVALTARPADFPVDIKGQAWLLWLDRYCPETGKGFSTGSGIALLSGPYEKLPAVDLPALRQLIEIWILKHRNQWQPLPSSSSTAETDSHA